MGEILDAAAAVFAEIGYASATTNAIAARAGISPGSLYQFFANKETIAQALGERFVEQMRTSHASAFAIEGIADLRLDELLDRIVDPLVAFNVANPGMKALLTASTDLPAQLAPTVALHNSVLGRVEAIVAVRLPGLSEEDRSRCALVALSIVKALMGPIVAATGTARAALVTELKRVLHGYLAPLEH